MLSDSRIVLTEKAPTKFWYGDSVDFHTVMIRIEEERDRGTGGTIIIPSQWMSNQIKNVLINNGYSISQKLDKYYITELKMLPNI